MILDSVDSSGQSIRINSGPFFRFSVSGGSLNVARQTIEGDFFIEKQSNSGGGDRLTVAVQGAESAEKLAKFIKASADQLPQQRSYG